jgi:talin
MISYDSNYKQNLNNYGRNVAHAVTDIVNIAESMKSSDMVDPEDPTEIAESELMSAADAIESAAKKLARLKPRAKTEVSQEIF